MNHVISQLRSSFGFLRNTPLHPQWLLPSRIVAGAWISTHARGVVLDIGCADRWAQSVLSAECFYVGLDYPATGLALYGSRPDVLADAARLPIADQSIDTVLMLDVLEHLAQPALALSEIARVLRPDGKLLVSVPFLYPIHDAPHDYQRYTAFGLQRVFESAGLAVAEPAQPTLRSASSAGVVLNLALAGALGEAIAQRRLSMVLAPVMAITITLINLTCWVIDRVLPSWSALTTGYQIIGSRKTPQP
jgi:SAM-dependent methyltransferase